MREGSFKIPILGQVENSEEPKVREGSFKVPILGQVENSEEPKAREGSLKMPILSQDWVTNSDERGPKCERGHSK